MLKVSFELKRSVEFDRESRLHKYSWLAKFYDNNMDGLYSVECPNPQVIPEILDDANQCLMDLMDDYDLTGIVVQTNCAELVTFFERIDCSLYYTLQQVRGRLEYSALPLSVNASGYDTVASYDASYSPQTGKAVAAVTIRWYGREKVYAKEKSSTSIFGAEHLALDMALEALTSLQEVSSLGRIVLCGDNQQLVSALYSVQSGNNRRVAKSKRKIRQLGADVLWVPSKENDADEFTRNAG